MCFGHAMDRFLGNAAQHTAKDCRLSARLISVTLRTTLIEVTIRNFVHKGLRRLYEENNSRALPAASVDKLRKMFVFMDAMEDADELRSIPTWKPHLMTGDRKGTWSLYVTRNWRITFRIDAAEKEICDVNFEDYH